MEGGEKEGFLHLCSDERVWTVKQVSTSNSVYITRTSSSERLRVPNGDGDGMGVGESDMDEADEIADGAGARAQDVHGLSIAARSSHGVSTISQVKNILELIEMKPDEKKIEMQIRGMVPLHHDAEDEADEQSSSSDSRSQVSLRDVLDNIPAPTNITLAAMKRLFIFGLCQSPANPGGQIKVSIPSPALLLKAWHLLLQQSLISSHPLDRPGGLEENMLQDLLAGVRDAASSDDEASVNVNVIMAIFRGLVRKGDCAVDDGDETFHVDLDLDCRPFRDAMSRDGSRIDLDAARTNDMLGRLVLHGLRQKNMSEDAARTVSLEEFLTEWAEMLPDSWARNCDAAALVHATDGVEIARDGTGKEVLRCSPGRNEPSASQLSSAAPAPFAHVGAATAQGQKSRKWHDKFGEQRNTTVKK